eukprot:15192908-Alexandrium_andersonii.AAC.1
MSASLVGSEMCIRDRPLLRVMSGAALPRRTILAVSRQLGLPSVDAKGACWGSSGPGPPL